MGGGGFGNGGLGLEGDMSAKELAECIMAYFESPKSEDENNQNHYEF